MGKAHMAEKEQSSTTWQNNYDLHTAFFLGNFEGPVTTYLENSGDQALWCIVQQKISLSRPVKSERWSLTNKILSVLWHFDKHLGT